MKTTKKLFIRKSRQGWHVAQDAPVLRQPSVMRVYQSPNFSIEIEKYIIASLFNMKNGETIQVIINSKY